VVGWTRAAAGWRWVDADGVAEEDEVPAPLFALATCKLSQPFVTTSRQLRRQWLDSWLDKQPSFRVKTRERKSKPRATHCRSCGADHINCPSCQAQLRWSPEKGVDTAMVTDLRSVAGDLTRDGP
jgi:hypothetical protein